CGVERGDALGLAGAELALEDAEAWPGRWGENEHGQGRGGAAGECPHQGCQLLPDVGQDWLHVHEVLGGVASAGGGVEGPASKREHHSTGREGVKPAVRVEDLLPELAEARLVYLDAQAFEEAQGGEDVVDELDRK